MAKVIEIQCERGQYSFDPETERIFKDGELVPSDMVMPIYSYYGKKHLPQFAGIWLRDIDSILTQSGKINVRTGNKNLIQ